MAQQLIGTRWGSFVAFDPTGLPRYDLAAVPREPPRTGANAGQDDDMDWSKPAYQCLARDEDVSRDLLEQRHGGVSDAVVEAREGSTSERGLREYEACLRFESGTRRVSDYSMPSCVVMDTEYDEPVLEVQVRPGVYMLRLPEVEWNADHAEEVEQTLAEREMSRLSSDLPPPSGWERLAGVMEAMSADDEDAPGRYVLELRHTDLDRPRSDGPEKFLCDDR